MRSSRSLFRRSLVSGVQLAELTLSLLGIIGLVVGLLVMPSLELQETGFYVGLLALVALMLLSFCAGQLIVIRDRLPPRRSDA